MSNQENIQSVIARVAALLKLADPERNTNENEAKAARAAADRLIQEHRLTMAELEIAGTVAEEPFKTGKVWHGGRRIAWVETILHALCESYGGDFYFYSVRSGGCGGRGGGEGGKGTANYNLIARESDYAIIEYLLAYLTAQVDRLGRWHCGGEGVKYAAAWRAGCANGIAAQLRELREAGKRAAEDDDAKSTALAVLDNRHAVAKAEMHRRDPSLKTGRAIHGGTDVMARAAGYAEGRKIQIHTALPSGNSAPALSA